MKLTDAETFTHDTPAMWTKRDLNRDNRHRHVNIEGRTLAGLTTGFV